MTFDPRVERTLPTILADLGAGPAPDYTDLLLERTATTRQRPAWTFPGRWLPVGEPGALSLARWRLVAVALLVIAILIALAVAFASGSRRPLPFGPARNGPIVFSSLGEIYLGDPVTGETTLLVSGPEYDSYPVFSPDGSHLAFRRRVDPTTPGKTNIVVALADGTHLRVITESPLAEEPGHYAWTPDGRTIHVVATDGDKATFEGFDTATTGPPRVIDPGVSVDVPWAYQPPDGARILFRGHVGSTIGIYTMNPDGSGLTPVVGPFESLSDYAGIDLTFPSWSPDGKHIAFQQVQPNGVSMAVSVADADGSNSHRVGFRDGDAYDGWAFWSPDGERIVFQRASGARTLDGYAEYRYSVVRVADDSVVDTGPILFEDSLAFWSPDGTLLFEQLGTENGGQLFLDPDGGPPRPVPWKPGSGDWRRDAFP